VANYILRNYDDKLAEEFRERCAKEGRPQRFVLLRMMELYSKVGLEALEAAAAAAGKKK
jgi:hypothetical protein